MHRVMWAVCLPLLLAAVFLHPVHGILVPPNRNLAAGRAIKATSTCGEVKGQPIREMYCTIAGADPYSSKSPYSYSMLSNNRPFQEMRTSQTFVEHGQSCSFCEAGTSDAHPAENMVDGSPSWWQSPPLSRGMQYNEVNITIDLEQAFHVAYVWVQMANSPRPGTWVLEKSVDHGQTWTPWQNFANSPAECANRFTLKSLSPIIDDDSVICSNEFSSIQPMEHGEIMVNLLEGRPGKNNFNLSPVLQDFVLATNVRLRLIRTKTLQGHLMDLNERTDPSVTRRYYYAIKEIYMGGRCVCNGHAESCDVMDPTRPRTWICRCEHNTCGDTCDRCCEGFVQKKWSQAHEHASFECEPCNCHNHATKCVYDPEIDEQHLSLDIHGRYEGGGQCLECEHNTEGINCNKCKSGFYRPAGKHWNETDVCRACVCDSSKHTLNCAEETGQCECLPQFTGPNCDKCAPGFYHEPECRPCQCNVNGTVDETCLPVNGICPCKDHFAGNLCDRCASGYTNLTAGCVGCQCDPTGSIGEECELDSGQCTCKSNYGGLHCNECANGYFDHPTCKFCDCDPSGTEDGVCDKGTGQCLCKAGFAGRRCDKCDERFYGYPNCRECACNDVGSKDLQCDRVTGECPCHSNFTSRTCDRCAAGFYHYPDCWPCKCEIAGSKGLTCDIDGQCYCKSGNFAGKRCEQCKPNFYNYPLCEECNCHPSGVVAEFAGCDKVAPGELCTCRENVDGRTCSQCKPTFWDLKAHHAKGCVDCNCNITGTVSLLNICEQKSGQCMCKRHVGGEKCDECAEGFYSLQGHLQHGCVPCDCDPGGSFGQSCNPHTGQCRCRARIEGLRCDKPIKDHFFPTLWQLKYEAESGRQADGKPVRYAIDKNEFPDYSYRGYAVFSPIQDEIILDIDVKRAAVYRLLFHYKNPTDIFVETAATFVPIETNSNDATQTADAVFPSSQKDPVNSFVNSVEKPFVLNPGRWQLKIATKKRLFLDYVVLVPGEYYTASSLKGHVYQPCNATENPDIPCIDLLYPPLQIASRVDASNNLNEFQTFDEEGAIRKMSRVPTNELPVLVGQAAAIQPEDRSRSVEVKLDVPSDGEYYLVLEYTNPSNLSLPLRVRAEQGESAIPLSDAVVLVSHCPYNVFCREIVSKDGDRALLKLEKSDPKLILTFIVPPKAEFGIAAVNLIKKEEWKDDYLKQVPVCIRKGGVCIGIEYPLPPNSIVTPAGSGANNVNNTISGDKLPFEVEDAKNVKVMSLDEVQSTVDISGVVTDPGHYVFIVHYYNPDNAPLKVDVLFQNEHFGDLVFPYCPTTTGCRAIIYDRKNQDQNYFYVNDKYLWTFYHQSKQRGPIYIDSVSAVPLHTYSSTLLKPMPLNLAPDFYKHCTEDNYKNAPQNITDYCRQQVFSLTTEFNSGALPCECNPKGATDFCCEEYGGECKCKPNVIGRTCDRCSPGHYGFPDCKPCECTQNELCNEETGQCYCPNYVEGPNCDRCVPYAFGFDVLIGCQLCGCNSEGSYNGEMECDAMNGQCLCKNNVGGRKCEKCLHAFYGFPACHPCSCNQKGTTNEVCNPQTAECLCKKNVIGQQCDTCRRGTFDLRQSHPDGCAECFCFGVTDKCRSSYFPVQRFSFDDQAWKSNDSNANVRGEEGKIFYTANVDEIPSYNVYLDAPISWKNDYTSSYGLHIYFTVSCSTNDDKRVSSSAADVKLVSGDTVLDFWATQQPSDPTQPFKVNVTLLPDYWLTERGDPVTRSQLMMVLLKLERLRIKVSYLEHTAKATVEHLELEVAQNDYTNEVQSTASSVEICECPASYSGASCQQCAQGYYRVKSDTLLGSCVPCNCHGHSGTCDPETGICSDCQHSTVGEHCEKCQAGYYGNATNGSPYACLACACPLPTDSNNFALSCVVSEIGLLERCSCKDGYSGTRCESCADGFFGQPMIPGGKCQQCFCNENNDLSIEGACNPITGDCSLCQQSTDGRSCEYCKEWFYGDAIQARNCTECSCNKCGSSECDNKSGTCHCYSLVEGASCDKCVENAWGFDGCSGCRMCECAVAAANKQCDLKNGKCSCMPGAAGEKCDRCQHGYWDYSSQGCKKCDCESDLSMGTVCNIYTGQCQCAEGATGPRCDTCLPGYLRIPKHGCRRCEACALSLNEELNDFDVMVGIVNSSLGNVSSLALAGSRLSKLHKTYNDLNPQVDFVVSLSDGDSLKKITDEGWQGKEDYKVLGMRVNRTFEQLQKDHERINDVLAKLRITRENVNDLIGTGNSVLDDIRSLVNDLENSVPAEKPAELISDAKLLMDTIYEVSNKTAAHDLNAWQLKMDTEPHLLKQIREQKQERQDYVVELQKRLHGLNNASQTYNEKFSDVRSTIDKAKSIINSLNLPSLKLLLEGVEKDAKRKKEEKAETRQRVKNIKQKLEEMQTNLEHIQDLKPELSSLREQLNAVRTDRRRLRRSGLEENKKLKAKVQELEGQSKRIQDVYNQTTIDIAQPLEAITIYNRLIELMNLAQNKSFNAQQSAKAAIITKESAETKLKDLESFNARHTKASDDLDKQTKRSQQHQARLAALADKTQRERAELKRNELDKKSVEELNRVDEMNSKTSTLLERYGESVQDFETRARESLEKAKNAADLFTKTLQASNSAKANLHTITSSIPDAEKALIEAQQKIKATTSEFEKYKNRLSELKEKVALVREKANRVKLGAHIQQSSILELPISHGSAEFGAYTDTRLFFRTKRSSGLLFYLGNEARTNARFNDFIAVEIDQSRPRLVASLGREVVELELDDQVSDNNWRHLQVTRVGRKIDFQLSKPNSIAVSSNRSIEIPGDKSVFNLYDDSRHFIVGNLPTDKNWPDAVHEREFVGDIDALRLNGEPLGLWNSNKAIGITGANMRSVTDDEQAEQGISLNGKGYTQISVGTWNPRKQTSLLLSFMTHAPDGLLFFVGKMSDQLAVRLDGGRVTLSFDLGSGLVQLPSNQNKYNDGQWHLIQIHRTGRQAKLVVDHTDTVDGESPGKLFEMSLTDSFYLGGLPQNTETRFTVTAFRGCLKNLKLDDEYVDLKNAKASKGVQHSCPNKEIRVASLVSERSFVRWTGSAQNEKLRLSLRFRTQQEGAHVLTLSAQNEELLKLWSRNENIIVRSANGDDEELSLQMLSPAAERWHYVELERTGSTLKVSVDDTFVKSITTNSDFSDQLPTEDLSLLIGKTDSGGSFVGCVGDVILNGKLISFSQFELNEIKLTECSLNEGTTPMEIAPTAEPIENDENVDKVTNQPDATKRPAQKSHARASGSCALPLEPHGEREDVMGLRFGVQPGSRIEFQRLPDSIEQNLIIHLELRSNSANGIVLFISNEKHTDHVSLYILDGRVCLSYGNGNARLVIQSSFSILDDEWHVIKAEREGASAILFVDEERVAEDRVDGAEIVELEAPVYFGGLAKNLHSFTGRLLPGVNPEFSGCLRDLSLNDESYDEDSADNKIGVVPCSQLTEDGIFFAKDGGYAMLPEFTANKQFHFELEVKPRVKNAVLLSVGVIEYVTMQLVNGTVKLTVDDGAGPESIHYVPPQGTMLCDGNWHRIKAIRKKKIVTLNVDGKSNLMILKKTVAVESTIKDPLYLGGVPKDRRQKGLEIVDSYVGCLKIRTASAESKRRRRDMQDIALFGALDKTGCHIN